MSTRITPDWANNALTAAASSAGASPTPGGRASEASATTGLLRPMRRASRANLRGLPNVSR